MIDAWSDEVKKDRSRWTTGEEVFDWWMCFDFSKQTEQKEVLFDE